MAPKNKHFNLSSKSFEIPHKKKINKQEEADSDASSLGFANLGGVYLVMFVGSCFGSVYGLVNCVVSIYLSARENKVNRLNGWRSKNSCPPLCD